MSADVSIPPPPYGSPFVINGVISPTWANWIRQLYLQVGGASASSISSLTTAVLALQTDVTSLQASVDALTLFEFGRAL